MFLSSLSFQCRHKQNPFQSNILDTDATTSTAIQLCITIYMSSKWANTFVTCSKTRVIRRGSPQLDMCIFTSQWNQSRVSSESRCWRAKLFQSHCPATVKDWSPRLVWVLGTSHVVTLDDQSRQWLVLVILSRQATQCTSQIDRMNSAQTSHIFSAVLWVHRHDRSTLN